MKLLHQAIGIATLLVAWASVTLGFKCEECDICYYDETSMNAECCRNQCFGATRDYCNKFGCQDVHGKWGQWTGWSHCDATCNLGEIEDFPSGHQHRNRSCNSPPPREDLGGRSCLDSDGYEKKQEMETRPCRMSQDEEKACLVSIQRKVEQCRKNADSSLQAINANLRNQVSSLRRGLIVALSACLFLLLTVAYLVKKLGKRSGPGNREQEGRDGGELVLAEPDVHLSTMVSDGNRHLPGCNHLTALLPPTDQNQPHMDLTLLQPTDQILPPHMDQSRNESGIDTAGPSATDLVGEERGFSDVPL